MFKKFIELAQSRGKKYLWLEVLEQNERAYRFYEKQGMVHIKDTVLRTASQESILKVMGMTI
ncbi:N-acetyltransferase [Erwinia sp. S38]|uniref:GNAT family N-acetyltransferase n=1 Tax=Erwinia sp. S38 TaxID=2769338 RepID=UPI001F3C6582|nr:GNAT family N-acetyltransferase [Erwinia sp. S38]